MEVRATEEGASEGRSVVEWILAESATDNMAGLRKQADFLLVFHTKKLD